MSPPRTASTVTHAELEAHRRLLVRELLASSLYVALVLLGGLIAVPKDELPADRHLVGLILGTAVGLMVAHWYAFRLAAHISSGQGTWTASAAQEAVAQFIGGLAVAVLAAAPYLLLDGPAARAVSLIVLAALPALAGCLIARLRGRSWAFALTNGGAALVVALSVVFLKDWLTH